MQKILLLEDDRNLNRGISFETEQFADIAVVHDPGWTAEAIGNVLDNGVKYAPAGTSISIRMSELVSYVMIEVEDEGPGIQAAVLAVAVAALQMILTCAASRNFRRMSLTDRIRYG